MINQPPRHAPSFRPILIGGAIVTTIVSLSMHVVMLQVLGVPFPVRDAVRAWALYLDATLAALALILFYDLVRPRLARWPWWVRALIVAALYLMLKEVVRGVVMEGVVTTAFAFAAAQALIPLIYCIIVGILVVAITPWLRGVWLKAAGTLGLAALMLFAVRPLLAMALGPFLQSMSALAHADVYPFPYGWYVLVWAYATYLEPVIACLVIAALVWPGLSARPLVRAAQFAALILCMKGSLVPTLVYGFFAAAGVARGALSESQFLLETLVLALGVAATWQRARQSDAQAR